MTSDVAVRSMESTILLYKGARGKAQVQVIFDTNTFWLSQQRMAELFGVTVPTINYHLGQIEQSGEIHLSEVIRKILIPSDKCSVNVSDSGVHLSGRIKKKPICPILSEKFGNLRTNEFLTF